MPLVRKRTHCTIGGLGHKTVGSTTSIIRVVKFKSSTAEWPIRVKLKTIDYHKTTYTALSYSYEAGTESCSSEHPTPSHSPPHQSRAILCDGQPVQVSQELWDILSQLRRLDSDVPIWVDQLCINFGSREERVAQVNNMSSIYARASHVIVWLGKKTRGTDDAVLCMRKLVNAIDWRKLPHNFTDDFRDPTTYLRLRMDRISIKQWHSIYTFCHAQWFSRLWPFYELVSAKQALFLIGDCFMDYDFLMDFAMLLGLTGWLDGLSQMATESYDEDVFGLTKMLGPVATLRSIPVWHPHHADHTKFMNNEYGLRTEEERAWKFVELLLQNSERFECRDPRDRIFAPLAYARMMYANKPINKSWPIVDYATSVDTIYSHFANMIQKHTREPSILANMISQPIMQATPPRPDISRGRSDRRIPLD